MNDSSRFKRLEESLDRLTDKFREAVDRVVLNLRSAAYEIYQYTRKFIISMAELIWEMRKILYILFGFTFLFSMGVELGWYSTHLYLQIVGALLLIVGLVVLIKWVAKLMTVLRRSTQEQVNNSLQGKVPITFFLWMVVVPTLLVVAITVFTHVRFQFVILRLVQTEVETVATPLGNSLRNFGSSLLSKIPGTKTAPPEKKEAPPVVFKEPETAPKTPQPPTVEPIPKDSFRARVRCEPESVHTRGFVTEPDKPENRVDLTITGIDMDEERTVLHVAVSIHQDHEYALLRSAQGTYMTADDGKRYDLSTDRGEYVSKGFRELKYREIYKFDLEFPKLERRVGSAYFSHPQFAIIKLNLKWARVGPTKKVR